MRRWFCNPFWGLILLLTAETGALRGQESVPVPHRLQKNVEAFTLSLEQLKDLHTSLKEQTEAVVGEVQAIRSKMEQLPEGSRAWQVEAMRLETALSGYLAARYEVLEEMRQLRHRAIGQLQRVIRDTQRDGFQAGAFVRQKLAEVQQGIEATEAEVVNPAIILEFGRVRGPLQRQLEYELGLLQDLKLPAYEQLQARLLRLRQQAENGSRDTGGALRRQLQRILAQLRNGFAWVDTELTYLSVFARLRKEAARTQAEVLTLFGLIEKFKGLVEQVRQSFAHNEALLEEMDRLWEIPSVADGVLEELPELEVPPPPVPPTDGGSAQKRRRILERARQKYRTPPR